MSHPAICRDIYETARHRILWLLKEPNSQEHENVRDALRRFGATRKIEWHHTWRKVAQVSYGLLHPEAGWDTWAGDPSVYASSLLAIALLNVKEEAGEARSNRREIVEAFQRNEGILRAGVPDVVIAGNVLDFAPDWFPRLRRAGVAFESRLINKTTWINAYHPACRCSSEGYFERILAAARNPGISG